MVEVSSKLGKEFGVLPPLVAPPLFTVEVPSASKASSIPSLSESLPDGVVLATLSLSVSQPSNRSKSPSLSESLSI